MNNNELFKYFGTKIIIKWEHEVGDPKRKHKKKRIAKKWLKRYGTWQECDGACPKGYTIYVKLNNTLYTSRHVYTEIKRYVMESNKYLNNHVAHHGNNF